MVDAEWANRFQALNRVLLNLCVNASLAEDARAQVALGLTQRHVLLFRSLTPAQIEFLAASPSPLFCISLGSEGLADALRADEAGDDAARNLFMTLSALSAARPSNAER